MTGDVQQLPLESGSFDLVVCTLVCSYTFEAAVWDALV